MVISKGQYHAVKSWTRLEDCQIAVVWATRLLREELGEPGDIHTAFAFKVEVPA